MSSILVQALRKCAHWGWTRHSKGSTLLYQYCSLHTFLIWATHNAGDLSSKTQGANRVTVGIGVRVKRTTKPTALGALGLEKPSQREHGTTPLAASMPL